MFLLFTKDAIAVFLLLRSANLPAKGRLSARVQPMDWPEKVFLAFQVERD